MSDEVSLCFLCLVLGYVTFHIVCIVTLYSNFSFIIPVLTKSNGVRQIQMQIFTA